MEADMNSLATDTAEVAVTHRSTTDLNEKVLTSRSSGAGSLRDIRESDTDTRRERILETDDNERPAAQQNIRRAQHLTKNQQRAEQRSRAQVRL